MISLAKRLEIAFAHYETTVKDLRQYIRYRNRYLFFSLLLSFVSLVQHVFPQDTQKALETFLYKNLSFPESTDFRLVQIGLLIGLMLTVARYLQIVMSVNRQQGYVRQLEDKINCLLTQDLVTFEGKFYDSEYRASSKVYELLYKFVVPAAILATSMLNAKPWIPSTLYNVQLLDIAAVVSCLLTMLLVLVYWYYLCSWCSKQMALVCQKLRCQSS